MFEAIVTIDDVQFLISEMEEGKGICVTMNIGEDEDLLISAEFSLDGTLVHFPTEYNDLFCSFKLALAALLNSSANIHNEQINELNTEIQVISEDPQRLDDIMQIGNVSEFIASAA